MSIKEDGGPACPVSTSNEAEGHQDGPNTWQHPGMALRDWFAGQFLATYVADGIPKAEKIALACYEMADAMLAERAKR